MLVQVKDCVHDSSYQILAWSTGTRERAEIRHLDEAVRVVEKMEGVETTERGTRPMRPRTPWKEAEGRSQGGGRLRRENTATAVNELQVNLLEKSLFVTPFEMIRGVTVVLLSNPVSVCGTKVLTVSRVVSLLRPFQCSMFNNRRSRDPGSERIISPLLSSPLLSSLLVRSSPPLLSSPRLATPRLSPPAAHRRRPSRPFQFFVKIASGLLNVLFFPFPFFVIE